MIENRYTIPLKLVILIELFLILCLLADFIELLKSWEF